MRKRAELLIGWLVIREFKVRFSEIAFHYFHSFNLIADNWALLFAQKLALKNKFPLHVVFCLTDKFPGATLRTFKFMLDGLEEVAEDLKELDINFHLLHGNHTTQIPKFVKDFDIGCLVCDFR
jgi:deoxyribodipyrimidine photo-lyase